MNSRIVVSVQATQDGDLQVLLFQAPRLFPNARVAQTLSLPVGGLPPLGPPDGVRQYGQELFRALAQHRAIQEALEDAVNRPERTPIFFYCTAPDAERLAWETLCNDGGDFLALHRQRPIGRWADSVVASGSEVIPWQPPLKILAILSAMPYPAEPEWRGLLDAVQGSRSDQFPIELKVMVGEEDLLRDLENLDEPWVSASPVPENPADLSRAIENYRPQILHFFSHGTAAYGNPSLELGSLRDWGLKDRPDAGIDSHGSVRLDLEDLTDSRFTQKPWLVTLNCCEGARASEEVHSLAHALASGGVGAAVGMLEPFDANDAHEFCQRLYPAVLDHIREEVVGAQVGGTFQVDWTGCLYTPRKALSQGDDGDPGGVRRWALPVLYTPPAPFSVRLTQAPDPATALEARHERHMVEGLITALGDEAPHHTLSEAREFLGEAEIALFGGNLV